MWVVGETPFFKEWDDACIFEWVPSKKHWKINKDKEVWKNYKKLPFIGGVHRNELTKLRHKKTGEETFIWKPEEADDPDDGC